MFAFRARTPIDSPRRDFVEHSVIGKRRMKNTNQKVAELVGNSLGQS